MSGGHWVAATAMKGTKQRCRKDLRPSRSSVHCTEVGEYPQDRSANTLSWSNATTGCPWMTDAPGSAMVETPSLL